HTRAGFKEFKFKKVSGNFKNTEGSLTGIHRSGDRVDVNFEGLESGTRVSVLWGEGGNEEMSKKMLDFLAMRLDQIEDAKE
ncbi:MAG: hypothetical protein NE330_06585, partial [Lentisphaeraceae bacterium]|nr:hypothetical protein [Lentisphaeraceae bacterium]